MATNFADIAAELDTAALDTVPIVQLAGRTADLTVADAYAIQRALIDRRVQRGYPVIGLKMGFTSHAKMKQMGVNDLIRGLLTSDMEVANGGAARHDRFIHPRVEPEIAFRLKSPLAGAVTMETAAVAIDAVAPAIEIIDSRYRDFRFSLTDVIADNSSSSAFVVGNWHPPGDDLGNLIMRMAINGAVRQTGSTAEILGHPLRSLVEAARLAADGGFQLEAGWIILCGAATSAEAAGSGDAVHLDAGRLGAVDIRFVGAAE